MRKYSWVKTKSQARDVEIFDKASAHDDILELLGRAKNYKDKPHQLYSYIAALGEKYLTKEESKEVRNLMDTEYFREIMLFIGGRQQTVCGQLGFVLASPNKITALRKFDGSTPEDYAAEQ